MSHSIKHQVQALLFAVTLSAAGPANAAFFFFLPLGLFAGKGDTCVKREAKVGEPTVRADGNVGYITALSGTSYRCTNPNNPILAEIEVRSIPANSTQASILLPDGWTQLPVTDSMKAVGVVSFMQNRTIEAWMQVATYPRTGVTDLFAFVEAKKASQISRLRDAESVQTAQLTVGGLRAWRYEVRGRIQNGTDVRYTVTFIEGVSEVIGINAWTAAAGFDAAKAHLTAIADSVTGLAASRTQVVTTASPDSLVVPPQVAPVWTKVAQAPVIETTECIPHGYRAGDSLVLRGVGVVTIKELSIVNTQCTTDKSPPVQAVVMRDGPAAPPAAAAPPAQPARPAVAVMAEPQQKNGVAETSATSKLRELSLMLSDGLITQQDYEAKKAEILRNL